MRRTRSRAALAGIAALFVAGETARAVDLSPSLHVERLTGSTSWSVEFPGSIRAIARPRVPGGASELVLLVAPAPQPAAEEPGRLPACPDPAASATALFRLDRGGEGALVALQTGLPASCRDLVALDLDRTGREGLVLRCGGDLLYVGAAEAGPVERLHSDPDMLRLSAVHRSETGDPPLASVLVPGRFSLHGPGNDGARWTERAAAELPLDGAALPRALAIGSPVPMPIEGRAGALLFATPPEAVGRERLRTTLVEVEPQGASRVSECWARLPGAEHVVDHAAFLLGERPVLFVATVPADRVNLFGEKQLRVFPLEHDRSRLGFPPLFVAGSRMNVWQPASPRLRDADGDGRPDLVIGYWKGLKDDRVVLDAYLGREDGSFDPSPRTTSFDVDGADRSFVLHDADLDGDGLADLIVRVGGGLRIYPGLASADGRELLATEYRDIPLGEEQEGEGEAEGEEKEDEETGTSISVSTSGATHVTVVAHATPSLADMDGDGRPEILVVGAGGRTLHVVQLARAVPSDSAR